MDTLGHIEQLLAFSTQALGDIAQELESAPELDRKKFLKVVGLALYDLSELRNSIFKLRPELMPKHHQMADENQSTYQELSGLLKAGWEFELAKNSLKARAAYDEVLRKTDIEYFVICAQAGLFRVVSKDAR